MDDLATRFKYKISAGLLSVAMLLASANVFADGYFRGKDLLEFCGVDRKACGLFLMGVSDTHNAFVAWGETNKLCCKPSEVTDEILVLVVTKYLREHPEHLHLGAAGITLTAMSVAWPCR